MPGDLSWEERLRVREIQVGLRCVKLCVTCKREQPIQDFGIGQPECEVCKRERWFAERKQAAAVA